MVEALDPEGRRLPIKLDSTSNGEFVPQPLGAQVRAANELAYACASNAAKRLSLPRRRFLKSICGAAAALLAMNEAYARFGKTGG
ncbi:MAG TPA: amidohydrolase, partial [Gammaproteobacteria bacterium]|nr:amidohydrolase [Gammaproteobacteria bacterium]